MKSKTLPSHSKNSYLFGRVSVSASKKASITAEAAMAVPIFFLAVVCLLYLMEITAVRAVGAERLERSIVLGGSKGVRCDGSRISPRTGIGEIKVTYEVRLPFPMFGTPPIKYQEKMRIKAWVGYEKPGFGTNNEETVYITETGMVYHKNYQCTYLELSIHTVLPEEIDNLRNNSGGKYYPCEHCMRNGSKGVYITDTGNRYHSSLSCSGLKRTVYAVPMSEVVGKGACSRCGQ